VTLEEDRVRVDQINLKIKELGAVAEENPVRLIHKKIKGQVYT